LPALTIYSDIDIRISTHVHNQKKTRAAVVQSWAQATPSKSQHESMWSFPATNKEALKNGCLTAKAQREYAKNNPIMMQNTVKRNRSAIPSSFNSSSSENECPSKIGDGRDGGRIFGIRSVANDVPMTELLRHNVNGSKHPTTHKEEEEMDYPDRSHMKKKGRLPPAKSTKSSRLLLEYVTPLSKEEMTELKAKEEFKMQQFAKVESKVRTMMR